MVLGNLGEGVEFSKLAGIPSRTVGRIHVPPAVRHENGDLSARIHDEVTPVIELPLVTERLMIGYGRLGIIADADPHSRPHRILVP